MGGVSASTRGDLSGAHGREEGHRTATIVLAAPYQDGHRLVLFERGSVAQGEPLDGMGHG
ncbi:hypothetical protein AB5J52_28135 [Streptomyces sp. R39]|uniref:Uncharacterized protein n=1 Tax=Streptomyces sp. R39 TaxID=3238631 RepID=A0AB39QTP4_9ACTN